MDGPLVSFKGSPTVSPTTAALCSSVDFPSTFFFLKTKGETNSTGLIGF